MFEIIILILAIILGITLSIVVSKFDKKKK